MKYKTFTEYWLDAENCSAGHFKASLKALIVKNICINQTSICKEFDKGE